MKTQSNSGSDWETRLTLLERACDPNDEAAWKEFTLYYRSFIRVVLTKMKCGIDDREDLEQEILLTLWKVLGRYDEKRASFRTWLSRIIYNKVVDHCRKRQRISKREVSSEDAAPEGTTLPELNAIIAEEWKRHLVELALERVSVHFTERAMRAFVMSMKGRSARTIGEQLNIKPNSVNKLKNRVQLRVVQEIELLRKELES